MQQKKTTTNSRTQIANRHFMTKTTSAAFSNDNSSNSHKQRPNELIQLRNARRIYIMNLVCCVWVWAFGAKRKLVWEQQKKVFFLYARIWDSRLWAGSSAMSYQFVQCCFMCVSLNVFALFLFWPNSASFVWLGAFVNGEFAFCRRIVPTERVAGLVNYQAFCIAQLARINFTNFFFFFKLLSNAKTHKKTASCTLID